MGSIGLADITLGMIGLLVIIALVCGVVATLMFRVEPEPLLRARRLSVLRATVSTVSALLVFAAAVLLHIFNPLLEGVPFALGPLAATATGLAVFAALPSPTIEGAVRRRIADVQPRRFGRYASKAQRTRFVVLLGSTVVVILAAGLASKASPDGRWLCTAVFTEECTPGGPYLFPGWLFAAPALLLVAALVGTVVLAVRRVLSAPTAAWAELTEADTALRSAAVRLVLRIASAPLLLTLGIFLGAAGLPLFNARGLDTGLSTVGDEVSHAVGIVLMVASLPMLLGGITLALVAIIGTLRLSSPSSVVLAETAR